MTVTRIILAAGAGSRLGGAVKALLAIGDRPALDRLAALQPPSLGRTIVITGFAADQVETECKRLGLESRRNPNWEQGQTSSLKCGLSMLQDDCEAFLLHPVDLPLVSLADYEAVLQAWIGLADRRSKIVVASHAMRRGHPALFGMAFRDAFLALGDDAPARDVLRAHENHITHVTVKNPWVLRDIDTAQDYRAATAQVDGD